MDVVSITLGGERGANVSRGLNHHIHLQDLIVSKFHLTSSQNVGPIDNPCAKGSMKEHEVQQYFSKVEPEDM